MLVRKLTGVLNIPSFSRFAPSKRCYDESGHLSLLLWRIVETTFALTGSLYEVCRDDGAVIYLHVEVSFAPCIPDFWEG